MGTVKKKRKVIRIDIFKVWCKSCGICVAFCPSGALGKNEMNQPVVTNLEKCTDCGWCEIHCPDFAISVGHLENDKGTNKRNSEKDKETSVDAGE